MAKKEFNLGDSLAGILGNVSLSDTEEQIEYIPLQNLVSDERNFYSMDGVDALAANIELIGLQQPLRVLAGENGFYVIVSGHRRAAALRLLAEEAPEKWTRVPCIVEKPGASPELEELRLIMANADTRRMSSADMAKQAERVETLLYELKEQGYEFPGRMRDHVAEACKVGATKLAELKVIREKLIPVWVDLWERSCVSHSCAYRIAQAPAEDQHELIRLCNEAIKGGLTQYEANVELDMISRVRNTRCGISGDACHHISDRVRHSHDYSRTCECCRNCSMLSACDFSCPDADGKKRELMIEEEKERKIASAKREADYKAREALTRRRNEERIADANRIKNAARSAGVDLEAINDIISAMESESPLQSISAILKFLGIPEKEIESLKKIQGFKMLATGPLDLSATVCKLADVLHCSTDYLLGRADEPAPWAPAWISVDERYPDEGEYCLVCTASRVVLPAVYFRASFLDFTEKSVGNVRIQRVEHWMPLPKAPGKFKYMGQETLDSLTNRG